MLTIITVTKDDLEGLVNTVKSTSVLRTDYSIRQIIVDSSSPEIKNEAENFARQQVNVEYVWLEPSGIADAFNQGIASSTARWVWFLNGRDEAHPDLDARFLLGVLNASQAEVLICEIEYMQSGLRCKHPPLWALWPPLYWMPHPATIIRRDLFDRYGLFSTDFKIAMDADLWIRFFTKDIVIDMLSIPISLYDENGVSSTEIVKVQREADKIVMNNFSLLFKIWLRRGLYLFKALKRSIIS